MNLSHLGDALDHWKGSLIDVIGEKNLQVVPMLTDRDRWTQERFEIYARLLHRKPEEILKKEKDDLFSSITRHGYFRDLGENDLFLNPDTGIMPDEKARKKHISHSEIAALLPESSSRILFIYQHASRNKNGVSEKLGSLRDAEGLSGCAVFAYDSGAVSMVVISRNRERADKALARLKSWLGTVASSRVI